MNKPRYWNSQFAVQVMRAYDEKKLTETNVHEWETEYNNGVMPEPSLGTREILNYYIEVERKEVMAKLNNLWSKMNGSEQSAVEHAIDELEYDDVHALTSQILESYASRACHYIDNANGEPEYEDEDFADEEVNKHKVLDYLLVKYHLDVD